MKNLMLILMMSISLPAFAQTTQPATTQPAAKVDPIALPMIGKVLGTSMKEVRATRTVMEPRKVEAILEATKKATRKATAAAMEKWNITYHCTGVAGADMMSLIETDGVVTGAILYYKRLDDSTTQRFFKEYGIGDRKQPTAAALSGDETFSGKTIWYSLGRTRSDNGNESTTGTAAVGGPARITIMFKTWSH